MLAFILQRLMQSVLVMIAVGFIAFSLFNFVGDPVLLMLPPEATTADRDEVRKSLGLDQPIYVQFVTWLGSALTGDFGYSMWTGKPVLHEIAIRLELSLEVAVLATILAVALALPLGTLSAIFKDTWIDHVIRVFSIAGLAMILHVGADVIDAICPQLIATPRAVDAYTDHMVIGALAMVEAERQRRTMLATPSQR